MLATLLLITVCYSWSAVNELAELIEAEPDELPDSSSSLLSRAEHNIAAHLHVPHRITSERTGGRGGAEGVPVAAAAACRRWVLPCSSLSPTFLRSCAAAEFRGQVGSEMPGGGAASSTGSSSSGGKQAITLPAKQGGGAAAAATTAGTGGGSAGGQCSMLENTDYWGEALVAGAANKKATAAKCCASCRLYTPEASKDMMSCNGVWGGGGGGGVQHQPPVCLACAVGRPGMCPRPGRRRTGTLAGQPGLRSLHPTPRPGARPPAVWVWCGDAQLCGSYHQDCWLKHLAHPYGTAPARVGPDVGWTTGIMTPKPDPAALGVRQGRGAGRTWAQGVGTRGGCGRAAAPCASCAVSPRPPPPPRHSHGTPPPPPPPLPLLRLRCSYVPPVPPRTCRRSPATFPPAPASPPPACRRAARSGASTW